MDYKEKTELTAEITKSTKRKMKTCIVLGFAALLAEIGFWYLFRLSHQLELDASDLFLFGMLLFLARMMQFSFIAGFFEE